MQSTTRAFLLASAAGALAALATAQSVPDTRFLGRASQVVIPQSRAFAVDRSRTPQPIVIESVSARVVVLQQTARTALEVVLRNPSPRQAEAMLLMPVPAHAVVGSFLFEGVSPEPTAKILPLTEARALYESIVRRLKDPALLEFAGHDLLRSSVFPVAAGGTQRIQLTYEHLLTADGNRIDYVLPRSESLDVTAPWQIDVQIDAKRPIATVFSPSHEITSKRKAPNRIAVRLATGSAREPGPFRLSYLMEERDGVTASMFAYPDPETGGGYFLLLAGLPPADAEKRAGLRREVTLVLDRSGSMAGEKMDQARAAASQVIEGLADGEGFNIVDYATNVASFSTKPVRKTRETVLAARRYLASLRPGGGTNIHDALLEALRPEPLAGTLPLVLFLTDGLPTIGRTSEVAIREMVQKGNGHNRRVFTFGVGHDVNVPLLDRIAEVTRATTTYVLPKEDVELKVAQVFRKLYGPVLSDARLVVRAADGAVDTRRVRELQPAQIPDLFENDQLVLLGQYRGEEPLRLELKGSWLGAPRTFAFRFELNAATTRNAFVPRLWASRRIAFLIDQVRQAGAAAGTTPRVAATDPFADPKLRELREEILVLSTKFGILSEYTAFLATEGTALGKWGEMVAACGRELDQKAMRTRSGVAAVNQGANLSYQKQQSWLNYNNVYLDSKLERVQVTGVQQVSDRAFFRRGKRWIDGQIVRKGDLQPDRIVPYGSTEHLELLRALISEGRNSVLSMQGEILLQLKGEKVLVVNDC